MDRGLTILSVNISKECMMFNSDMFFFGIMQRLSLIHECKLIIQIKIFCVMIKVIEIQPSSPSPVYKGGWQKKRGSVFFAGYKGGWGGWSRGLLRRRTRKERKWKKKKNWRKDERKEGKIFLREKKAFFGDC